MSILGKPLFGRDYNVTVAPANAIQGLDVSNLRCTFKAKKSLRPEPNTCEVQIFGLSEKSRHTLERANKLIMRLEAGYIDTGTSQLFLGEVRNAWSKLEGVDIITTIATGDGETEIKEARLNVTIGPNVPLDRALQAILDSFNKVGSVGSGNLFQAAATLRAKGVAMFGPGTVLTGNTARRLTDICRSAGLEWSIQDGNIQILNKNKPIAAKAINLSASSGLIGSPEVNFSASSKTKKGGVTVKAKCFIIPGLDPGKLVVFDTRFITGGYRIEDVSYEGDTHGDAWFTTIECRAL